MNFQPRNYYNLRRTWSSHCFSGLELALQRRSAKAASFKLRGPHSQVGSQERRRASFRMLVVRADHSRNVSTCWRAEFFFASMHARACVARALRAISPDFFTLAVTASSAKCKAPTCCCNALACCPLHVAFQAAPRGREPQGFSDPGGHARDKKVQSRGPIATTVDRVSRSSVQTWVHEDMCVLQSALWRFCSGAHGVYILKGKRRSDRPAWPRDSVLLASTFLISRYVASGASRERKIVGRLTHGYNIEKLSNCISFLRRNSLQ